MAKTKQGKTQLIVERSGSKLFGRVTVNDNLIIDHAESMPALKKGLKKLILEFEEVAVEEFAVVYDLTAFFASHPLNTGDVARKAGISPALMRQYASGLKFPSAERLKQIEKAIHEIGRELAKVRLNRPQRAYA